MTKNGYYSLEHFIFKKLQNKTREIDIDITSNKIIYYDHLKVNALEID